MTWSRRPSPRPLGQAGGASDGATPPATPQFQKVIRLLCGLVAFESPAITLIYRYPVSGAHELALSSGGVYSAHADFFNAWKQVALTRLVNVCLNGLRHCGRL